MRIHRVIPVIALLLGAQAFAVGCLTLPTMADRVVELVTTGALTEDFHASGVINTYAAASTIDLNDLDIAMILDDAGIDLADVTGVSLSNVAWRVTAADAAASRAIDGQVQVSCGGRPLVDLIAPFHAGAGTVTEWKAASLDAAGVSQINATLAAMLAQLKGGPPADASLTYAVTGTSTPADLASDFHYELRLTVNIQGRVKTEMLTGR